MQDAKNALDELSQEREARWAAEDRARAAATYRARIDGAKAEGRDEGLREGRREGRQEGSRDMLCRILVHRFGELPSWALERVKQLDVDALAACGERALSATTLEEALE